MMNQNINIKKISIYLAILAAVFLIGRYSRPSKIITKTEIKEIVKIVEVEKKKVDKDVVTEIIEITKPDGTKEKKTVIVDKSKEESEKTKLTEKEKAINKEKIVENGENWSARVMAGTQFDSISNFTKNGIILGLGVDRKIIGPFTAGVFMLTNKTVGVSIGAGF